MAFLNRFSLDSMMISPPTFLADVNLLTTSCFLGVLLVQMDAFRMALNSRVDCVEIDVSRSSDGVLFALHDR